jgi:hypothetical protein
VGEPCPGINHTLDQNARKTINQSDKTFGNHYNTTTYHSTPPNASVFGRPGHRAASLRKPVGEKGQAEMSG